MTTSTNTTANNGTSIIGLLGVAFIVLKLCHVIDWSWWLVTLPLWGGLVLWVAVLAIGAIVIIVGVLIAAARDRARDRKTRR